MVSVKTKCFISRWTRYPECVIFTRLHKVFSFFLLTFFKYTDKLKRPINSFLFRSTNFTVSDNIHLILSHPLAPQKIERYLNTAHEFTLLFEAGVCESCNVDIRFRSFFTNDKKTAKVLTCRNASMTIFLIAMHSLKHVFANMGVQNPQSTGKKIA